MSRRQMSRPIRLSAAASRLAAALLFMAAPRIYSSAIGHVSSGTTNGDVRPDAVPVGQKPLGGPSPAFAMMARITA